MGIEPVNIDRLLNEQYADNFISKFTLSLLNESIQRQNEIKQNDGLTEELMIEQSKRYSTILIGGINDFLSSYLTYIDHEEDTILDNLPREYDEEFITIPSPDYLSASIATLVSYKIEEGVSDEVITVLYNIVNIPPPIIKTERFNISKFIRTSYQKQLDLVNLLKYLRDILKSEICTFNDKPVYSKFVICTKIANELLYRMHEYSIGNARKYLLLRD